MTAAEDLFPGWAERRPKTQSAEHTSYARRTTAPDCPALLRSLGHARFMVGGHDGGGRVAYRLALDHPEAVMALLPIDILATAEVGRHVLAEENPNATLAGLLPFLEAQGAVVRGRGTRHE